VDLTPLISQQQQTIGGYGNGGFKINQEWVSGSLMLFAGQRLPLALTDAAQLTLDMLAPLLTSGTDILLIGTGQRTAFINPALRKALKDRRLAVDSMDTGAACRTYNVLLMEERRVAAILIAV
jgi:uncharacterized protein